MRLYSVRHFVVLAMLALSGFSCGERHTSSSQASRLPVPSAQARPRAVSPSVALGDDLVRACRISVSDIEKTPKFDFDQSELSTQDRDVLSQVARCLTTGPLRGRAVRLVGRADPRGESEYNMTLGGHRAESVKTYLTHLGVDSTRVAETSRGELDASGRDEDGWRRDRRVDVVLQ
jgi:peptidoglycan-associated lipoprotein